MFRLVRHCVMRTRPMVVMHSGVAPRRISPFVFRSFSSVQPENKVPVPPDAPPTKVPIDTNVLEEEHDSMHGYLSEDVNEVNQFVNQNLKKIVEPIRPVLDFFGDTVNFIHETFGIGTWACIILVGIAVRASIAPLFYMSAKNNAMFKRIGLSTRGDLTEWYRNSTLPKEEKTVLYQRLIATQPKLYKLSRWKSFLPIFPQVIAIILISLSCRLHVFSDTVVNDGGGGAFWFPILSHVDKLMILPLIHIGATYFNLSKYADELASFGGRTHPIIDKGKEALRLFILMFFPVYSKFAAGYFMYLVPSALFSSMQRILVGKQVYPFNFNSNEPVPILATPDIWPYHFQPTLKNNPFYIAEKRFQAKQDGIEKEIAFHMHMNRLIVMYEAYKHVPTMNNHKKNVK